MNQPASGLRHQPPPALADYSGPPNGDYVRYVEQLMQWSEQEHRRTGGFTLPTAQPHAGQVGAKASAATKAASKKEEVVRQVTQMLAQSNSTTSGKKRGAFNPPTAGQDKPGLPAASMKVPSIVFGMVLLGLLVLKAEWIPLAIVLWVVWNVRRLLRSAKAASSTKSAG
ncbi:MAG TPA: hypothetical protein PLX52_09090 [Comamonas denitrificans]|jgi:hypothetical protein|nr:hypothetical protein [Comamonas denitrificans]